MCPCRAFNECFFLFLVLFVRYLGFCICWDIWGLTRPHIFGEKMKQNKKHLRKARQGHIKHVCKISGSNSQKQRGHSNLYAVKCKNHGLASYLLGFSIDSILGVKFDLILVLRSQFFQFSREIWCKHALKHLEAAGLEKKRVFFFLPTINAYQYLTSSKVCDWSGHIFGASASPRSSTKKRLCHPLPLFMAVSMIPYVTFELLMHAAFVADEIWGFMPEPARNPDPKPIVVFTVVRFSSSELLFCCSFLGFSSVSLLFVFLHEQLSLLLRLQLQKKCSDELM